MFERMETPAFGGEQEGARAGAAIRQALARAKAAGRRRRWWWAPFHSIRAGLPALRP
ncbi:hypothetical protein M8494_05390 [Serratia ureilytica]